MGLFNIFKKDKEDNNKEKIVLNENIGKAISEEEKQELIKTLPTFEYHPNVYKNGIVEFKYGICNCCGKEVKAYVGVMYTNEDVNCICMNCIKDGYAAEKFNGSFIQYAQEISNQEKTKILYSKTPGYVSWQGEYWLACCDDYCEFIGDTGIKELKELGISDEVIDECCKNYGWKKEDLKNNLTAGGTYVGYLFKCKHCGKYHLYVDLS